MSRSELWISSDGTLTVTLDASLDGSPASGDIEKTHMLADIVSRWIKARTEIDEHETAAERSATAEDNKQRLVQLRDILRHAASEIDKVIEGESE